MNLKCNPIELVTIIVVLGVVDGVVQSPRGLIGDIEHRQSIACLIDKTCDSCWRKVGLVIANEKSKHEQRLPDVLRAFSQSAVLKECDIHKFVNLDQYCCQMWDTFDCRLMLAKKHCDVISYVKFHKNMVDWANTLMLMNLCTDFDYNSHSCQETKKKLATTTRTTMV